MTAIVTYYSRNDNYSYNSSAYQGAVTIPSSIIYDGTTYSVTSIGVHAFRNCYYLTSVEIPSSVASILQFAFFDCSNLTSLTIPNSVTNIYYRAFQGCRSLTSVTIEDGTETLSFESFSYISATYREFISDYFSDCPIETLYLGRNINYSLTNDNFKPPFANNSSLTSVIIGNSVTNIRESAFEDCSSLTSVTFPSNVTSIGNSAFSGCSGLTSIDFPNRVASIGNCAFQGCSGLTSINLPNKLNSIGYCAFKDCSGLTSIDFPNRVNSIGNNAFEGCNNLTSLSIPISVTSIGGGAFQGCTNLESVYSEITDVFSIDAFDKICDAVLYVPYGKKLTYIQTPGWNVFNDIIEMDPAIMNTSLLLSCNSKGSITINGTTVFTNKIGSVDILEDAENTIVFTPKANCKLEQVCFNGFDVTTSVENNTLKAVIPAKSQMVVTFANESGDMNNDGIINISDVVLLVNMILGQ